jgi:drug/metabolite transporter (DMT)-like permease
MHMVRLDLWRRGPREATGAARRALSPGDLARLALVIILWAVCFPLIAVGLAAAPPLYFGALRAFVAGLGLLLPAALLRRPLPDRRAWPGLLGAALAATSLGFMGMFLGGGIISPGLATVLANTQPLIAAVLAYAALNERLGRGGVVGLLLGFAGILLIALSGSQGEEATTTPLGVIYVLLGAVGVAGGNVLLKRLAGRVDPLMATGWQLLLGGLPLLLASLAFEAPIRVAWSPPFVAILLALGLLGTALAFVLWFSLLGRAELTRLNSFTFLTPVLALLIGVLFFGERLPPLELGGIGLTLVGTLWVSRG